MSLQRTYLITIFSHHWFVRLTSQRNVSKGEKGQDVKSPPANLPFHLTSANTGLGAEKIKATLARWLMDNGTIVKIGQSSSDSSPATLHSIGQWLRWLSFTSSHKVGSPLQDLKDLILPGAKLSAVGGLLAPIWNKH